MRQKLKELLTRNIEPGSAVEKHKHKIKSVVDGCTDEQVEFFISLDNKFSTSTLDITRKTRFNTVNSIDYFVKNGKKFFNQAIIKDGRITFYFNGKIIDKKSLFSNKQESNQCNSGGIYADMMMLDYIWDLAQQSYKSKQ